jgi:hypothetical protein
MTTLTPTPSAPARVAPITWTETTIARALALQFFKRRYLCVVPNCTWTGHECDLLVVTDDLRIIDVEIKISRADLKADAKKEKWWHRPYNWPFTIDHPLFHGAPAPDRRLLHPAKVWKHYYALPMEIWKPELETALPSSESGILLLNGGDTGIYSHVERRAKPARDADVLTSKQAIDIARLASLRMWNTYQQLEAATSKAAA